MCEIQCLKVKKCLIRGQNNDHLRFALHCIATYKISQQQFEDSIQFICNKCQQYLLVQPNKRTSSARLRSRTVTRCPFSVCDAPSHFCRLHNVQDNTPPIALFHVSLFMSEIKNGSMISLSGKLTLILEAARFCVLYNCLSDSARRFPEYSTEESNLSERRVC